MDTNKPLPTTTGAVDAYMREIADFRGVDKAGQPHYLLGMCEALLARANADNLRLEAKITRLTAERDRLEAMLEGVQS